MTVRRAKAQPCVDGRERLRACKTEECPAGDSTWNWRECKM